MSGKTFSILALFVGSVVAGVLIGEWFFHLFLQAVPPVALSNFNTQASRIAHWMYGAGVGVAMFVWAMIGMGMGKVASMASKGNKS
jgi:hypothetical protein